MTQFETLAAGFAVGAVAFVLGLLLGAWLCLLAFGDLADEGQEFCERPGKPRDEPGNPGP